MMQQGQIPYPDELERIQSFAQSEAAKQLYAALRQKHNGEITKAMEQIKRGDYSAAGKTISGIVSPQQLEKLTEQFRSSQNG